MKVLHLIKTGVGATWALRQIRVLIELGVEVNVALVEDGPMAARYEAAGARVHRLSVDIARIGPVGFPAMARQFRDALATIRPDIVHSHFVGTTLFARLAMGRASLVPRLFQVPGPLHLEKTLTRAADLRTAGTADYWCASCDLTRRIYLRSGVEPARLSLSYYGTDIQLRPNAEGTVQELRRAIGVPDGDAVVGMVAYMYPPKRWLGQKTGLKGHEDLIEAIGLLRDRGRKVTGVFVGGAWGGAAAYEARVRRIGRDRLGDHGVFLGNRDDVPALYRIFAMVAHPSHSESLGGGCGIAALGSAYHSHRHRRFSRHSPPRRNRAAGAAWCA
jgi:glycosyltransferase involved in cell wall biosynthesis